MSALSLACANPLAHSFIFRPVKNDGGQQMLRAALRNSENFPFKIVSPPRPENGFRETVQYFTAQVCGMSHQVVGEDGKLIAELIRTSNIVTCTGSEAKS
jgi:hypothetical protein